MHDTSSDLEEQVCAVPYRFRNGRPEFCLIARNGDSRWDFPRGRISMGESRHSAALHRAQEMAGLHCEIAVEEPLDEFSASKVDEAQHITAFLVSAQDEDGTSSPNSHRRRWCFAEEAKVRIRRKPVRRLIDFAVRHLLQTPLQAQQANIIASRT